MSIAQLAHYKTAYQRPGVKLLVGFLMMTMLLALFVWLVFRSVALSMPHSYLVGLWVGWLISGMAVGLMGASMGSWKMVTMKPHGRSLAAGSLFVMVIGIALTHGIIHGLTPLHMTLNGVGALLMGLGVLFGFAVQFGTLALSQMLIRLVWHVMSALRRPQSAPGAAS